MEAATRELAGAEAGDGRDESNRSMAQRLADAKREQTAAAADARAAGVREKGAAAQLAKLLKATASKDKESAQLERVRLPAGCMLGESGELHCVQVMLCQQWSGPQPQRICWWRSLQLRLQRLTGRRLHIPGGALRSAWVGRLTASGAATRPLDVAVSQATAEPLPVAAAPASRGRGTMTDQA